ncbi:MAG: hypothetical protein CL609_19120 [Anaerolineaceae bacterium]|nr:hypothetical protein [Anaerolineaceae bacterium]
MKSSRVNFQKFYQKNLWLIIIIFITQGLFLMMSYWRYRNGFPLDDAWIHQTYARNFAKTGVWAFNLNVPSGGSTSPLWSFLLIPGHLMGGKTFLVYTYLINWILLFFSAVIFENIINNLVKNQYKFPVFGVIFLLEWHFIWAANSGMETILFILLILLFFDQLLKKQFGLVMGVVLGLILWVRPDGLTLLGPLLFVLFFSRKNVIHSKRAIWGGVFFFLSFVMYIVFNLKISGSIFPNTFYAKQAEYAILYERNILFRFWDMLKTQFIGFGILLIPGLINQFWEAIKNKKWVWFGLFLWWIGYLGLYALRLPVTYQHGRYQIPAISVFLLLSIPGCVVLINKMGSYRLKLIRISWIVSTMLVMIIFVFMGADAYATDVAIIETEMVNTAIWINEFTEQDAIIAAHDIGALGFYGNRLIIDLAGLISPEVIPYINDEVQIIEFLNKRHPDYLMTFENWYNILPLNKTLVYSSTSMFSIEAGGSPMQVYIWKP